MRADEDHGTRTVHRVIARLNVGGPTMHVVHLAAAMNDGRWRTRLIAGSVPDGEGDMGYYARDRAVTVTRIRGLSREIGLFRDVGAFLELLRLFRRERPDIVHTHTAKAGALGRAAAILAGVPVRIHTFHGHVLGGGYFPRWKTRLFLAIERWLARRTDRLVVLTQRQASEMCEELRVAPRDRFVVIPLGLDLERFVRIDVPVVRSRVRSELGVAPEARLIGIVGRLVPIKNHELFLEAVTHLRESADRPVVAVVVGSGEREAELARLASSLGAAEVVRFLGWRRDLPELYAALDALALTSHDEGTPVAVLEALAAGTPVVARDVGGVQEVLKGVGAGVLLGRDATSEEWAKALRRAAWGPRLDPGIRSTVASRFAVARLVGDVERLYEEELACAPRWKRRPPWEKARADAGARGGGDR